MKVGIKYQVVMTLLFLFYVWQNMATNLTTCLFSSTITTAIPEINTLSL